MRHVVVLAFVCLSLAIVTACEAQTSVAESDLVLTFLSHRSGYNQIYTCGPDGSNPQPFFGGPLTDIPSNDSYEMYREPHWTLQSPNGKYFASWVFDLGKPRSEYDGPLNRMLWVGEIHGTWNRVVATECQEQFAWSPNSNRIAYSFISKRPESTKIFLTGIDGSNNILVLEQPGKWLVLDWSSDGKRLLLTRKEFGKFMQDVETIHHELFEFRLTDALEARKQPPRWAGIFLSQIDLKLGDLQPSTARYSPTRNEIAVLVFDRHNMYAPNLVEEEGMQSRMARLLAKIYVYDLETKDSSVVANYDYGLRGPICWSPDGNEILFSRYLPKDDNREKFASDKTHGLAIWAIGRDGSKPRFVTTGWSPDFPHQSGDGK